MKYSTDRSETQEHNAVVKWMDTVANLRWPQFAVLDGMKVDPSPNKPRWRIPYFHPANGGKQRGRSAGGRNNMGVRKGVPDLEICVPSGRYHGLYVEIKRMDGGVVSEEQYAWQQALQQMGYRMEICKGSDAAIEVITEYFEGRL